mgnify:CR=1 FL=1
MVFLLRFCFAAKAIITALSPHKFKGGDRKLSFVISAFSFIFCLNNSLAATPPAKIIHSKNGKPSSVSASIICGGSIIEGSTIIESVISPRVIIHENATVENCIIFENVKIGKGVKMRNCIVDKNTRFIDNTIVGYNHEEDKRRGFTISEKGITIIPMNSIVQ